MQELSHHAYVMEGPLSLLPALAADARAIFGFPAEHSPDVFVRELEKLGVEEAAELRTQSAFKSVGGKALFVVGFSLITSEAQQSLLKMLEEPQAGTVFVLLAPHGSLLPTIKSRVLPYPHTLQQSTLQKVLGSPVSARSHLGPDHFAEHSAAPSIATLFLKSMGKERSTQIAALLKEEEGERERVRAFLADLEQTVYKALATAKDKKPLLEGLSDIHKVRSYVSDRSPSLKMLLEHVALSLPKL